MHVFDDFDAWGDAVSGASLRLACDAVEVRRWTLGILDLGDVSLQMATEGGGNLCYGGSMSERTMLFLPLNHTTGHVVNGEPLDDESLLVIPHGADFRITVRRKAHAWCSISLPFAAQSGDAWIARDSKHVPRLRHLVNEASLSLLDRPAGSSAHAAAGRRLADEAARLLERPTKPHIRSGRPRFDRTRIIRAAMAVLDSTPICPSTTDLARSVGVTARTLLRTFQESFGVSPKRYLLLRELHAVHRELASGGKDADTTVADVLTRHGIWEFGRFAARYRRQFGELPSATLRRGCS